MPSVEERIIAGELPEEFIEQQEIIPPEHPLAKSFAGQATHVIRRLLGANYDPALHDFRVLLTAQQEPNAFVISRASPPIIAFSAGLLKLFESEDHFAAVTAHELTHKRLHDRLGEHLNSKLEEQGSDLWGVKALQDAGYRPRAMAEMLSLLPQQGGSKNVQSYMDVHPGEALRVRLAENATDVLVKMTGTENAVPTPLNEELWGQIRSYEQPRYMERLLSQLGFDSADNTQKIKIISQILETESLNPDDEYRGRRVADLGKAIKSLKLDQGNSEEIAAYEKLGDQLTARQKYPAYGWERTAGELYPIVYGAWKQSGLKAAPGQVGALARSMHDFIHASSPEAATSAAQSMRQTSELVDIDLPKGRFGRAIDPLEILPVFEAPTASEVSAVTEARQKSIGSSGVQHATVPLPWQRHIGWAKDDLQNNRSPEIQIALAQMGITRDYGLVELGYDQPKLRHQKYGYETDYTTHLDPLVKPKWGYYDPQDLDLSSGWDVLGYKQRNRFWPARKAKFSPELFDRFSASEAERMAKRDAVGKIAAESADWHLLEKPGRIDEFDRIVQTTGYEEGSYALHRELSKLDWYNEWRSSENATRDRVLEYDEQHEHTRRFAHFVEQNRDLLIPDPSIIGGGMTFEKAFAERLKALSVQDPQTYNPLIRQFFSGVFHGYVHDLPKVSVGNGNSFPDLLKQAIERNLEDKVDLRPRSIIGLPVGLNPDHPYMSLVTDPDIAVQPEHRVEFLANTRYLKEDKTLSPADRWHFDPVTTVGLKPLETVADFSERHHDAKKHIAQLETKEGSTSKTGVFFSDIMATEVYRHLVKPGQLFNRDELVALEQASRLGFASDMIRQTRSSLDDAFVKTAQHDLSTRIATPDLVESYAQFSHYNLFLNQPGIRHQYEQEIAQRISAIADPETKREMTEKILLSREMTPVLLPEAGKSKYKSAIADPDFRQKISSSYVDSLVQLHGKDDGSPAFEDRIRPLIDDIMSRSEGGTRFGILSMLADRMEMQRPLSYYIRDQVVDAELVGMKRQDGKIAFGEMSIDQINRNNQLRLATIDFMRGPLTRETASRYVQAVKEHGDIDSILPREAQQIVKGLKTQGSTINPEVQIDAATQAHRNFWSMPLGMRTLYFEKIVFPIDEPNSGGRKPQSTFDENKKLVLDIAVPKPAEPPKTKPTIVSRARDLFSRSTPPSQATIARDFVESYLTASGESEQRLFLTAMLVANEPVASAANEANGSFGKSLRRILYATGPAGVKIAQAIHSHPATPEWLRNDMEESKKAADLPLRWTVHELAEKNGLTDRITHVGPVLGAGAYGITVETHRTNGIKSATTFLRPDVRTRADREFGVFANAGQDFVGKHPAFSPVLEMIGQAKAMAKVETDMDLAAKQAEIAKGHYDGVVVVADKKKFVFRTAPWLGHGNDYKETGVVAGQHFNDLPSYSAEEKAYSRASAKALLTVEQRVLLSGKPFDHDRHGGQQKLDGAIIGQFDHGAMALEAPTNYQKKLMGRVFGSAIREHVLSRQRTSVADALVHQIDVHSTTPEDSRFLIEVKRAFLAQNDFMKPLSPNEVKAVIASAWTSPDVDPLIRSGMKRALGPLSPFVTQTLKANARDANVSILPERAPPAQPALESYVVNAQVSMPATTSLRTDVTTETAALNQEVSPSSDKKALAVRRIKNDYGVLNAAAETARLGRVMPAIADSAHGAVAGLGVVGAVGRLNGQLQEDMKGDKVQAAAGVAAMASDSTNAAGGIISATTQVVERVAPGVSEGVLGAASRIAGRVALPLAVASAGADVVAGIRSNDAERVAGASGGLAGGVFGGVAAGAAAGALLGVETGPGAIVTGIVGGVVGGIVGEKVAKEYLSDGVRWLMGSKKEEEAKPHALALSSSQDAAPNRPSRLKPSSAPATSAAPVA